MNRCIYCDVNVKCCTIICRDIEGDETETGGCWSATAMRMFVYQIKHDMPWRCRSSKILDHGLKVTKVYKFIEYHPSKCFEKFGLNVSEAHRAGDSDPSKAVLAESQKLHGNSSYGKCLTNKEKHREVHYCNRSEVTKLINSHVFHRLNIITDDLYEVECLKKSVKEDLPLQISFFVYGYAKLRMLEIYFDVLLHFMDGKDFQCVQSDTDSLYIAFSCETLADCVKPHMRREYFENLHHWLPLDVCD